MERFLFSLPSDAKDEVDRDKHCAARKRDNNNEEDVERKRVAKAQIGILPTANDKK